MGNVSVIDNTVYNFGLPIVCRHLEYIIDMFTSLDLGMNKEKRYWVPGASDVFWKPALSQSFFIWQYQNIDRKIEVLGNGEGILSDGAVREMGRKEPSWGDQALRQ